VRRFNDPEDRNRPPEDLTAWLAAGIRRVDAQVWRRWNFSLEDAKRWRAAGVTEALTAAQWQVAGAAPDTVSEWVDAKITVGEAIRWHEFGFDLEQAKEHAKKGESPDAAYQKGQRFTSAAMTRLGPSPSQALLTAGVSHELLVGYIHSQWTDEEAIKWAKQGIQSWDARMWQEMGLTAVEAGELTKAKTTPADVMRDWWRAGIPFDEVADWLGAGLSPEEAVAQRDSGVTAEQAAALRALRRGGMI
jgi:hypothetical protein